VTINTDRRWEVDLCDSGDNIICIVDISMATLSGRGSWMYDSGIRGFLAPTPSGGTYGNDFAYADGNQLKCISGPITVMLLVADTQVIDEGTKLQCISNGMFGVFLCFTTFNLAVDPCALIAEAMEAVTTTTVNTYVHAKLLI